MTLLRTLGVSAMSALLSSGVANAASYTFTQGGFSEGAFISGTFEAADGDSSGEIVHHPNYSTFEVTAFSVSFSGNSIVGAFTLTYSDLFGLVYEHQNGSELGQIGTTYNEGLSVLGTTITYEAGRGPGLTCYGVTCGYVFDGANYDDTNEFVVVSPASVPLPSSAALLAIGAGAFAVMRRRKRG